MSPSPRSGCCRRFIRRGREPCAVERPPYAVRSAPDDIVGQGAFRRTAHGARRTLYGARRPAHGSNMHIELTEMLRCPEPHREEMLVLSTGEVKDRMVRSGLVGCPVCHKEYPIARGVVNFRRSKERVSKDTYTPPSP